VELSQVIKELVEERGIDQNTINSVIADGILSAYRKKYPDWDLSAEYDRKSDQVNVFAKKTVVGTVADEAHELSVRRARHFNAQSQAGDEIVVPFEKPIGRIEILKAKQYIAQKIREVEARLIYDEFKPKEGTIITGVVHKCDRNGATIKVQDAFGFLPRSLMIPGEQCFVGYTIRARLREVLESYSSESQLVLDRTSPEFLRDLFDIEIPEVFERLVEIKKVVRAPGYKAKVLVSSNEQNIDPVGTCVGVGGARIKPILREIGSEKIDLIPYSDIPEELVAASLKPARAERVTLVDGVAHVWVEDDYRSQAIGKNGQNISLASQLVGYEIVLERVDKSAQSSIAEVFGEDEHEE
jgi:N utilization substance protein A